MKRRDFLTGFVGGVAGFGAAVALIKGCGLEKPEKPKPTTMEQLRQEIATDFRRERGVGCEWIALEDIPKGGEGWVLCAPSLPRGDKRVACHEYAGTFKGTPLYWIS